MNFQDIETLEQKVLETKELFKKVNQEAFEVRQVYSHLEAKANELREEWAGLREAAKVLKVNPIRHYTGLILLEQKIRSEYRDIRIASLRTLQRSIELLSEVNRIYKEYMALKKHLNKTKEVALCG